MGLSIHYSGCFRRDASLIEMIEEVKDIAEIYKWKYSIYDNEFSAKEIGKKNYSNNIYGISFTPLNCETISLTFLSNARLCCNARLKYFGNSKNKEDQQYLYMLSAKTQFAGTDTHKILIHLLKYLSKKYFSDFELSDEGEYWESGDEKLLEEKFKQYNELLDNTASSIQNYPMQKGESFEQYFSRVLKHISKK